jgi:Epoxide hydrolase N terminus
MTFGIGFFPMAAMPDQIEPFVISVAGAALDELRDRLGRTRWPEREPVGDWSQGVPLDYLQDLCGYWAKRYDWRRVPGKSWVFWSLRAG